MPNRLIIRRRHGVRKEPVMLTPRLVVAAAAAVAAAGLAGCSGSPPAAKAAGGPTTSPVAAHHDLKAPAPKPTCPLTGQPPAHPADLKRPALAVKIDNVPEAMPQAGVNDADVVVQEQVEGGLTRLFAIFQCTPAAEIGPVRSARTTDLDLLSLLHGSVFAFSGYNSAVGKTINNSGAALIDWGATPGEFHLDTSRPAPHDVFSSSATLLKAGAATHKQPLKPPPALFHYGPLPAGARHVHSASMSWPGATAGWTWDGHAWLRTQDGAADRVTTGAQVATTNVVVMGVKLKYTGLHDVLGNPSPDDVVVGHGKAWVLRDGRVIAGHWQRPNAAATWTLKDRHGRVIDLAPGRTWVELVSNLAGFHTSAH
jgi:hypothetical protein